MKKALSVLLAVLMACSVLAFSGSAFAAETDGISITFGVYDGGMFTMTPQKLYVTADLDDRYETGIGWGDSVSEPSILDAIVKAHLVMFGEGFEDYAPIEITNQYGYPMFKSVFGESTNALGYRVNGDSPLSPGEALSDGDYVEFYFYQDSQFYGDKYTFFDEREITVKTGEEFTLTMNVEDYDENWQPAILPMSDMSIVDGDYHELGTTDENGQVTLSFDKIGTYGVTATGLYETDYDDYDIFAPYCTVNVTNDLYTYVNKQIENGSDYILNGYEDFGVGDAVRLATVIMSGVDMSRYAEGFADSVEENLKANDGKLISPYSGKEDLGLYGATILALDAFGYVPSDFRGFDLAAALEAADITAARTHPYYARFAVEAASEEKGKAIIQDMIDRSYRMGAGLYNGVYCCDNTSYFLLAVSKYADDFRAYVDDAKQVIQSYTRETGCYNDNVGMVTEVNADSTALAMAAYAAVGDMDGAFRYYKMLCEGFEGDTGIFLLDGDEDYYATADAVLSLGYFRKAVKDNNYEHPQHIWRNKEASSGRTNACVVCGEKRNGFVSENGKTYYYRNGAAVKYMQSIDGDLYYFNGKGEMYKGWLTVKATGKRYYFGSDGAAVKYRQTIGGNKYYFNGKGEMYTGWLNLVGKRYYFGKDGAAVKYRQTIDGNKYYFNGNGEMYKGWLTLIGKRYYFGSNGAAVKYLRNIDGKQYYFNSNGEMYKGWLTLNGKRCYFGADGAMQ